MITDIGLILRTVKGSPLTAAEVDQNFSRLRQAILDLATVAGSQVVIGNEPPAGEREGVIWVPSDFRGIYVWDVANSQWVRISEPKRYATSTNVGNNYTVTIPGEYADINALAGHILIIKANAANSGASQLKVNAFGFAAIKKYGSTDLQANDITANSIYALVYDGSAYQLLNPTPQPSAAAPTFWTSSIFPIPNVGTPATVNHPFNKKPEIVRMVAVCKDTGSGYTVGDEIDAWAFTSDIDGGDVDQATFVIASLPGTPHKFNIATAQANNGVEFVAVNGNRTTLSFVDLQAKFDLKIYAVVFP